MVGDVHQISDDTSFQHTLPKLLQVEQRVGQQEKGVSVPVYGKCTETQRSGTTVGSSDTFKLSVSMGRWISKHKKSIIRLCIAF